MTPEQKRVRRLYDRLRKFCVRVEAEAASLKPLFPATSDNPFGDGVGYELELAASQLRSACLSARNAVALADDYAIRRRGQ